MKENNNNANNQFGSKESNCGIFKKMSCMSPWTSRICIAVVFAAIGFCSATVAQNRAQDKVNINTAQLMQFDDPFFTSDNIFKEMTLMEKNMDDMFAAHREHMAKIFDQAAKNNISTTKTSVSSREDEANYYYDLAFSGFKKDDIVVAIKDNNLTFSAKKDQDKSDKDQKLKSSTNFYYSFFVPQYNTKIDPEITKQDDKITVKFAKIPLKKTTDSKN